jgi:hypothetical protein
VISSHHSLQELQEKWNEKSEIYHEISSSVHFLRQIEALFADVKNQKLVFATEEEKLFIDSSMKNFAQMYTRWRNIAKAYEPDSCHVTEGCLNTPASFATPCGHYFCCKLCRLPYVARMINEYDGDNVCLVCNQPCELKLLR